MNDKMQPQDQSSATIASVSADLQSFAQEMRDLFKLTASREDLKNLVTRDEFRRTAVAVAKLTEDVADIRNHVKEKLVTRDEFHSRMDGFAGRVSDFDYSIAKNRLRLDDHEERLKSLEDKGS